MAATAGEAADQKNRSEHAEDITEQDNDDKETTVVELEEMENKSSLHSSSRLKYLEENIIKNSNIDQNSSIQNQTVPNLFSNSSK